jgi:hypothetical protein
MEVASGRCGNHYRKRSLYRELCSVPRARSKALGTGTLCESKRSSSRHRKNPRYSRHRDALREQKIELSAQKKPAVQTYFAETEQSSLSAQPATHGTEELCRELQKRALSTAETSRRKVTAVGPAVGPAVRCVESPPMALGTEICAECLTKALGKELKNQIHTFKPFASSTYTPTKSICSNFT